MPDFEKIARENGWAAVENDPNPIDEGTLTGPVLFHAELDLIWPLGDWRGACEFIDVLDD